MDAESNVLQFVLAHSRSRQLVVRKGDSIDLILRTELYVSSKNQPIAYRLYKDEFLRRNPRVEARTGLGLLENETISIPSGPRYSALHIERMLATIDRIGQGKTAELDFRMYSKLVEAGLLTQRALSRDELAQRLTNILGHLTRTKSFVEIRKNGMVPPIDSSQLSNAAYLNFEAVGLDVSASQVPSTIKGVFPNVLPMAADEGVDCGANCKQCKELVAGISFPKSNIRLLVADTGIRSDFSAPDTSLAYSTTQNDFSDMAPNEHGSFVYSEIVSELFGTVPKGNVDIAKISRVANGDDGKPIIVYDLIALSEAVQQFALRAGDAQVIPSFIGVVNVSASGWAPKGGPPAIFLGGGQAGNAQSILFIAAAGNNSGDEVTKSILFAIENNPSANLIVVGALGVDGKKASYSNFSEERVDLFAQGSCICGKTSQQINGTSQATPIVSVAAVTLAASRPGWGPQEIKWRLISTSDRNENVRGLAVGGVLNLRRALLKGVIVKRKVTAADGSVEVEDSADSISVNEGEGHRFAAVLSLGSENVTVLRLFRKECSAAVPNFVCFRSYALSRAPEPEILVPRTEELRFMSAGTERTIHADELVDLILPIRQDKSSPLTVRDLDN